MTLGNNEPKREMLICLISEVQTFHALYDTGTPNSCSHTLRQEKQVKLT